MINDAYKTDIYILKIRRRRGGGRGRKRERGRRGQEGGEEEKEKEEKDLTFTWWKYVRGRLILEQIEFAREKYIASCDKLKFNSDDPTSNFEMILSQYCINLKV